jgi:hypothetical protein
MRNLFGKDKKVKEEREGKLQWSTEKKVQIDWVVLSPFTSHADQAQTWCDEKY